MSDDIQDLHDRTIDVVYEVGETEYDYHVTIEPPDASPVNGTATINLTRGDLKDGFAHNFKEQYLGTFFEFPGLDPDGWLDYAAWIRNEAEVAEEVTDNE